MPTRVPIPVACAVVGVLPLGGGCATHVPVSATVLFHDGTTQPTHDTDLGFGVAVTVAPTLAPARAVARQRYPEEERRRDELVDPRQLGGGLFVARYGKEGRYAFSTTLGFLVAGLDATLKIRGRNYLTVGFSAPNQGQVFLQHRAFNSSHFGAAIGLGGRYNTYRFNDRYFEIETEGVASVGTRGFMILRAKGDTGGGIKLGTYVGYAPELERPVGSLTLMVGRF